MRQVGVGGEGAERLDVLVPVGHQRRLVEGARTGEADEGCDRGADSLDGPCSGLHLLHVNTGGEVRRHARSFGTVTRSPPSLDGPRGPGVGPGVLDTGQRDCPSGTPERGVGALGGRGPDARPRFTVSGLLYVGRMTRTRTSCKGTGFFALPWWRKSACVPGRSRHVSAGKRAGASARKAGRSHRAEGGMGDRHAGEPLCSVSHFRGKPRRGEIRPGAAGMCPQVMRFGQNALGGRVDSAGIGRRKRARKRSERAPADTARAVSTCAEQHSSLPRPQDADILPLPPRPRATELDETSGALGRANTPSPAAPGFPSAGFLLLSRREGKQNARRGCFSRCSRLFYRARSLSSPLTFST